MNKPTEDHHDIAGSGLDKGGVLPFTDPEADGELTPKEEAVVATQLPRDEQLVKINQKLEHDAAIANRLPETEQLRKYETKLEHDDSGNQPS